MVIRVIRIALMNTPSHILINLALLRGRRGTYTWPIIIGALLPDMPMFLLFAWAYFIGHTSFETITTELYYSASWQNIIDLFNSIPLIAIGLAVAVIIKRHYLTALFASMLAHIAFDLPVHTEDAHRHFWPLSNYRFHSPFSYWNPSQYSAYVSLIELTLVILATIYLFKHVTRPSIKYLIIGINAIYILSYITLHIFPQWQFPAP